MFFHFSHTHKIAQPPNSLPNAMRMPCEYLANTCFGRRRGSPKMPFNLLQWMLSGRRYRRATL